MIQHKILKTASLIILLAFIFNQDITAQKLTQIVF